MDHSPPPEHGRGMTSYLSRRAVLRGLVGLGAGATLAGCSAPVLSGLGTGGDAAGSLAYWNLFGGGDGVRMTSMIDNYRAANPDVDLKAVTLAWGNPYYTKLSLATLGGKPPDMAVSHLTRAKTLVASGLLEEITPDDMAKVGIAVNQLDQTAWNAGLVEGKSYAIPLDTHPFVMFYNTEICEKAGLLDSSGALQTIDSPEKFMDAMNKAKDVTKVYGGVTAITSDTSTPWRMFQSWYSQLGGETLADEGRKVVIDEAKAMQVLQFMQTMTKDGAVPGNLDYAGSVAAFATGQAGFYFQGEWEISTFQTAKTPFSMTLFPNLYGGDKYSVQADSHTLVIPKGVQGPRKDRAMGLIKSFLDQSKTWAEGGHVPSWLPFRDSPEFEALKPQANYAAAAEGAAYDPEGWYSGSGSNFEIVTGSNIATVLAGQEQPAAALEQMRTALTSLANTASPI
jgi:multiple sugar transport system substrate-binding protein